MDVRSLSFFSLNFAIDWIVLLNDSTVGSMIIGNFSRLVLTR